MQDEEKIIEGLTSKFPSINGNIQIKRERRIFADVPKELLPDIFKYANENLDFNQLCTITGMDEVETYTVVYHLCRNGSIVLNLKTHLTKDNPVIRSIIDYFPAAEMYEREMEDLLGIKVAGLPPGHNYPLPDNWPAGEHPLRKDWKGVDANACQ
jgi:Ni,Fe-hydrogenase III component G